MILTQCLLHQNIIRSRRSQSDQSPMIIALVSEIDREAGKESALIVANAIMTNSKYFWCPHLERVHTVSELWCLVWHEFCLFSVSDCVFITWYLSNTSCLLRAIGMFVVQYLQGVLELYMVGVRRVRSVDKWLATLQGSKYPQAVPCCTNWLLTNKTLWNFHFQNYNYRMFPALLQTALGLWEGKYQVSFYSNNESKEEKNPK